MNKYINNVSKAFSLGVVGATGLVGSILQDLLVEFDVPLKDLRFFASANSKGKVINFKNSQFRKEVTVEDLSEQTPETLSDLDIAIFSAGASRSKDFAPVFAKANVVVVDNSSFWRSDPQIPLVVSEVNPEDIDLAFDTNNPKKYIIANPNCTTMAIMPILKPLHDKFSLKKLIVSTYQAVSGMGTKAIDELFETNSELLKFGKDNLIKGNIENLEPTQYFPAPIAFNVVPYAGQLVDDEMYETDEEKKLRNESRKILHIENLLVNPTCVRVPVVSGHSLSVTSVFDSELTPSDVVNILKDAPGVELSKKPQRYQLRETEQKIFDDPITAFPTPLEVAGKNPTYIGRIRQDYSRDDKKGIQFFASNDNLRKGAALNALQIALLVADRIG